MNEKITNIDLYHTEVLLDNYELQKFYTNHSYNEYLIISKNRHYKINKATFILIQLIEKYRTPIQIAKAFTQKQNREYSPQNIIHIINNFFVPLGIVSSQKEGTKHKPKSFLWVRIPILKEKTLYYFTKPLKYLFTPRIAIMLIVILVGFHLFFIINNFKSGIYNILNDPLLLFYSSIILFISAIFHELGHVAACTYYKVQYKAIGLGLYLTFPVLYSDISNAWRIESNKRAVIDIAGLYFQLIFNLILFVFYLLYHYEVYLISIKLIILQSIIILNPFFRFDGYWLAADLLNIPNLRRKSVEYIKFATDKYIFRKTTVKFNLEVNKKSKLIFILYAVISNLFIGYFIVFSFIKIPKQIVNFPGTFLQLYHSIDKNFKFNNWKQIGIDVYQFSIKLLFLFISIYFIYKISIIFLKAIKKYYL